MKNLISLLTYVLEIPKSTIIQLKLFKIELYANFLNQNLSDRYEANGVMAHPLNRFTPCDLEGNFLKKPNPDDFKNKSLDEFTVAVENFRQATKRVLFENTWLKDIGSQYMVVYDGNNMFIYSINRNKMEYKEPIIIDDLVKYKLELTNTAQKIIGVSPN